MRRLSLLSVVAALTVMPAAAGAAPTITVRERARIELEGSQRTETGVRLRGWITEAASGTGLAGATVAVRVGDRETEVQSGDAGHFEAELRLEPGSYPLAIRFAGDSLHEGAALTEDHFDVGKAGVTLTLSVPPVVEADAPDAKVTLAARSEERGPAHVSATLTVFDGVAATGRPAGTIETGDDGEGAATLRRDLLGRPGDKRLVARFDGNAAYNPTEATTSFQLVTATKLLDLSLPHGPIRYEAKITARGRLVDAEGGAIEGALVSLVAGDRRVARGLTRADGTFALRLAASELNPGAVTLVAEYAPTVSYHKGARSTPVTVTILEPRPIPIAYILGAFAATALALLGFVVGRARPWARLAERIRRRRDRATPPVGVAAHGAPGAGGLTLARPSLISTLRRPTDVSFSGKVRDSVRGIPLVGAVISVVQAQGAARAVADAEGQFEIEALLVGTWYAEAALPGYVTERFQVTIPHRGELRGARIDLVPVRERIFAVYREVAARLLPKPELWGLWTPREIFRHVRERRPAGALGELTDFVEETYFSPRVPDELILEDAAAHARAARAELAPRA